MNDYNSHLKQIQLLEIPYKLGYSKENTGNKEDITLFTNLTALTRELWSGEDILNFGNFTITELKIFVSVDEFIGQYASRCDGELPDEFKTG